MKRSNSNITSDAALNAALGGIPDEFRAKLIEAFVDLKHRGSVGDSKGAASSHTHFCELVLRILQMELMGKTLPFGQHIPDYQKECLLLTNLPSTPNTESQRVVIPRALAFLHTLRNKRGTGHVGGDVQANTIDLATVVRIADWIISELLRLHHKMSLEEAQAFLDRMATRQIPDVWVFGETKRVLRKGLQAPDQTLLLLYGETSPVAVEDVCAWVEYRTVGDFKSNVVTRLHDKRWLECDENDMVMLTPLGEQEVEKRLLTRT